MVEVILASGSRVRARLLRNAGVDFDVLTADVDEVVLKQQHSSSAVGVLAQILAQAKAMNVSEANKEALVIGADQILECDGKFFDKPVGEEGVRSHLKALRGRDHRLISAVCVAVAGEIVWSETAIATLTVRDFDEDYIEHYIKKAGPEVQSAVGAYRLEDVGVQLFEKIDGDYFTILGLPMLPLLDYLRQRGILIL